MFALFKSVMHIFVFASCPGLTQYDQINESEILDLGEVETHHTNLIDEGERGKSINMVIDM